MIRQQILKVLCFTKSTPGEAGRGFAVVASEVRVLAQKTTEASKNISEIVTHNVSSTETGMKLVEQTSAFFASLVTVMEQIFAKTQGITQGSIEQAMAIEQVNQNITHLDYVTHSNAELGQELTGNVTHLRESSEQLKKLISQFRVEK